MSNIRNEFSRQESKKIAAPVFCISRSRLYLRGRSIYNPGLDIPRIEHFLEIIWNIFQLERDIEINCHLFFSFRKKRSEELRGKSSQEFSSRRAQVQRPTASSSNSSLSSDWHPEPAIGEIVPSARVAEESDRQIYSTSLHRFRIILP